MVDAFLDDDILINLLRNFPSSLVWKSTQGKAIWGIAPAAWMQVIEGASNKIAQQRAGRFLKQFALIYPTQSEIDWAMQQLQIFYLSHNVDAFDCLIAAPAIAYNCHFIRAILSILRRCSAISRSSRIERDKNDCKLHHD